MHTQNNHELRPKDAEKTVEKKGCLKAKRIVFQAELFRSFFPQQLYLWGLSQWGWG